MVDATLAPQSPYDRHLKEKNMKRAFLIILSLLAAGYALGAQTPKIAVLDATIPKGFDASVIVPITENIMEELVKSKKYTVLDRNNITAIFKERDFQLSGEVTDTDITKAGKMLGADFVVVSKMQQVGDSYFLTAKMINVTSSVIAGQASCTRNGVLTILLDMAHLVGWSLATGEKIPAASTTAGGAAPAGSPAAGKPSAVSEPAAKPATYAQLTDKKATLYTLYGLHPDKKGNLYAASFVQEDYLPPGTAIQFIDDNRTVYKFKVKETGRIYTYEHHKQAGEDFKAHLIKVFGIAWDPAALTTLSAADQAGIASGKVSAGMSRQGVELALGKRPVVENPDFKAKSWRYWKSRFDTMAVTFDDQGLVSQVKN
jgi:TolB-like protein